MSKLCQSSILPLSTLDPELAGRHEIGRVIEATDGQVAILAVDELKPQRRPAGRTERSPRNR